MKVNNKGQFKDGNQFWKQRSTVGRKRVFAKPKDMWKAFMEYVDMCDENPWKKHDVKVVDKVLEDVYIETAIPYTWAGFCVFIGTSQYYFQQFKKSKEAADFSQIISEIDSVMFNQKFTGAAVGAFNANIISRDLGLIDKVQSEVINHNSPALTPDEVRAYRDALNKEV